MTVPLAVLFGVPIDDLTMESTIERIVDLVADGRRIGRQHQIATVNVDFLVNALDDPSLLALLQNTSMNIPDGMPLLWAARLLGTPLTERVAGSDLVPRLARTSSERGLQVHLFGAAPGVADRAGATLRRDHPGALITTDEGPARVDVSAVDEDVVARIRDHDPDVLCVALGNPKQERFIATYGQRLGCPVMIGVGGSLDLVVGDKQRAPQWAQRTGTEWLFRAAQEPRRLGRRYANDFRIFAPHLMRYVRTVRRHADGPPLIARTGADRLDVGAATRSSGSETVVPLTDVTTPPGTITIDFTGSTGISVLSHCALVALVRSGLRGGSDVTVTGWSAPARHALDDFGTLQWFEGFG